jgi:hypothetical protein
MNPSPFDTANASRTAWPVGFTLSPTGVPDEPPTPREPPPPQPDEDDEVPPTPPTEPAPVPIQDPPSEPGGNVPQIVAGVAYR